MLKIFIVEDELPSLRSIKQKVKEISAEYEVVGEAINGKQALEHIAQIKPNVVITDIKMPVMDGLELIKHLREDYPDIIPVILSGYQEFEYARQAMKMNVQEYLLKPVSLKSMEQTLEICKRKILNAQEYQEYDHVRNVISGSNIELTNKQSKDYKYDVVYFCIGNCLKLNSGLIHPSMSDFSKKYLSNFTASEFLNLDKIWFFDGRFCNEKFAVIRYSKSTEFNPNAFAIKLLDYIKTVVSYSVNIAVSQSLTELNDISMVIGILRIAIADNLVLGKSQLIAFDASVEQKQFKQVITNTEVNKLMLFVKQNQIPLLKNEIRSYFNIWSTGDYPLNLVEKELIYILDIIQRLLIPQIDLMKFKSDSLIENIILISKDFNELHQNFCFTLDDTFFGINKIQHKKSVEDTVKYVEDYLKNNITAQISLQTISERLGISQAYLCRIFKRYKDMSPIDYFIKLKIEKAKEYILTCPDLMFKEIAESLGYDNPHYFSKLFKQIEGKSPSEFRNYG